MSTPRRTIGVSLLSRGRTTPYSRRQSSSGKCFTPFKSPSAAAKKTGGNSDGGLASLTEDDKIKLAQEVVDLKEKEEGLDKQITELMKSYSSDDLQIYIDKLHDYNEIKDVAQMLLGKLAEVEATTTKQLYRRFQLDLED